MWTTVLRPRGDCSNQNLGMCLVSAVAMTPKFIAQYLNSKYCGSVLLGESLLLNKSLVRNTYA